MLEPINKLSETTIAGKRTETKGLTIGQPEFAPLCRLGIVCGILSTMDGHYKLVRGDNEPLHTNLVYVLEGELDVETSEGDWVATPGTLIHMPSNMSRRFELRRGPRYRELFFKLFHTAECDTLKASRISVRQSNQLDSLLFAFERCIEEQLEGDGHSSKVLASYAEILAVNLQRDVQSSSGVPVDPYRRPLLELWNEVMANPDSDWSVERLAARIPISPTHFYRLVQKHHGCSPKQVVIHFRMERAQSLLSGTSHSISEIATMVGYANEYSFSNVFKKHVGQRPGHFRKTLGG